MHRYLALPNRVSRLYPIFSLVLLLSSSAFLYAWQETRIELDRLPAVMDQNTSLQKQIEQLQSAQQTDRATLSIQKQKIAEATSQLTNLQKQLDSKNAQISKQDQQIANQQDQLNKNASDLEALRTRPPLFSFQNNSTVSDISAKEQEVRDVVSAAYDNIKTVYGDPYLLNNITITFVDQFSITNSAGEIEISNGPSGISINIHLKDFDKNNFQDVNTIIHEIIHGFHGVAVFNTSALEEGITVAATDAVMARMIDKGQLPYFEHLYLTISADQYQQWNKSLPVLADNQAFYNSPNVAKVYQLIGKAWYQLFQADPGFFSKFNAAYYPHIQNGELANDSLVLNTIRAVSQGAAGTDIDTYLSINHAFSPQ